MYATEQRWLDLWSLMELISGRQTVRRHQVDKVKFKWESFGGRLTVNSLKPFWSSESSRPCTKSQSEPEHHFSTRAFYFQERNSFDSERRHSLRCWHDDFWCSQCAVSRAVYDRLTPSNIDKMFIQFTKKLRELSIDCLCLLEPHVHVHDEKVLYTLRGEELRWQWRCPQVSVQRNNN